MDNFLSCKKYVINLINKECNRYISICGFTQKDDSVYFIIDSGNKNNYMKFSYHPEEKRFQFAFLNEFWKKTGRPNKERIKSKIIKINNTQLLCNILIDKSSLHRKGSPKSKGITMVFPDKKILMLQIFLNNNIFQINHKFENITNSLIKIINAEKNKLYSLNKKLKIYKTNWIAQEMNDYNSPWLMLCFGENKN